MPITRTIRGEEVTIQDEERQPCEVWSRVMGYLRMTKDFNIGKKSEWNDRVFFSDPKLPDLPPQQPKLF